MGEGVDSFRFIFVFIFAFEFIRFLFFFCFRRILSPRQNGGTTVDHFFGDSHLCRLIIFFLMKMIVVPHFVA